MNIDKLVIHTPIWNNRTIGIACFRTLHSDLEVEIDYKDKFGKRLYPDTYIVSRRELVSYPKATYSGVRMYIVPISGLRVKERVLEEEVCLV